MSVSAFVSKIRFISRRKLCAAAAGAVGLLILILVLPFTCSSPRESTQVQVAAAQIEALQQKIQRFYRNRPSYWGLNNKEVLNNRLYPEGMAVDGRLLSPFQTEIKIGTGKEGYTVMPGSRFFDIVLTGLDKKNCEALAAHNFNDSFMLNVVLFSVFNKKFEENYTWGGKKKLPINYKKIKDICIEKNTLLWRVE